MIPGVRVSFSLGLLLGILLIGGSCRAQPPAAPAESALGSGQEAAHAAPAPGAPPPAGEGPRVAKECLDVYAECPPTVGMPAVSVDGRRVVVPDFGPDMPRDELVLTVRVLDVDSERPITSLLVLRYEDYEQGVDPYSGEMTPAFEAELDARLQAVARALAADDYRPLVSLGTVHQERPGEEVDGLRAVFDGTTLTILDTRAGKVRWRRAIGPSRVWKPSPELDIVCGPFPVADLSVWASREPSVAVVLVTYIGADLCATEYPYLVWR